MSLPLASPDCGWFLYTDNSALFTPFFKLVDNPFRISAHWQDGGNISNIFNDLIVNGIGKPLGKHLIHAKFFAMNPAIESQRFDVRNQTVPKILTNAGFLKIIKSLPFIQIINCFLHDVDIFYFHRLWLFLRSEREMNSALPSAIRFFLSVSTFSCHSGVSISPFS